MARRSAFHTAIVGVSHALRLSEDITNPDNILRGGPRGGQLLTRRQLFYVRVSIYINMYGHICTCVRIDSHRDTQIHLHARTIDPRSNHIIERLLDCLVDDVLD